jgi:hypothetical protein
MKKIIPNLLAIVIAMAFPLIMSQLEDVKSVSAFWNTESQPWFIIMNAATSYFLFSSDRWQMPGLLLLLLTAFSVTGWPVAHNIFAFTFFITATFPIALGRRLRWYLLPYAIGCFIMYFNLMIGELICIETLCLYHLHLILYKQWLLNKHQKSLQNIGK